MFSLVRAVVGLVAAAVVMTTQAGAVQAAPVHAEAAASVSAQLPVQAQAKATTWRERFGKKFARKANARNWEWIGNHAKPSVLKEVKKVRKTGKYKLVGDCYDDGKNLGSCWYDNYWVLDIKRTDNGIRAVSHWLAD